MKSVKNGFTMLVAVLAMSFTIASRSTNVKRDNGFWTAGTSSCTTNGHTYYTRVTQTEDVDCIFPSGVFCYYTVTTEAPFPCNINFFSFSAAKYKLAF